MRCQANIIAIAWAVVLASTLLLFYLDGKPATTTRPSNHSKVAIVRSPKKAFHCAATSKRWIVITSINDITDAVRSYAAISGWKTVVVADGKTLKDYGKGHMPPGLIFLSLIVQAQLPWSYTTAAPFGNLARNNIGYLYAVACGAELIYETDDDNPLRNGELPEPISTLQRSSLQAIGTTGSQPANVINPYAFFGCPDIWTRGYPLRALNHSHVHEFINLERVENNGHASIEQFLADNDPDVDAIFRLTRAQDIGHITFNQQPDHLQISKKFYAAYNAQTTMLNMDAFWSLYLPSTVTFRVTDIWRSYIAQRLLREMPNSALVFRPPIVQQFRNAHDLVKDMADENDLYFKVEQFLIDLDGWQASDGDMLDNLISIYSWLTDKHYFQQEEVNLVTSWVGDLRAIGYASHSIETINSGAQLSTNIATPVDNIVICVAGSVQDLTHFLDDVDEKLTIFSHIYVYISANQSSAGDFSKLFVAKSPSRIVVSSKATSMRHAFEMCLDQVLADQVVIGLLPLNVSSVVLEEIRGTSWGADMVDTLMASNVVLELGKNTTDDNSHDIVIYDALKFVIGSTTNVHTFVQTILM